MGFKEMDTARGVKITGEEFENGTEGPANPLDLFWQGIRAEATKKYYTQTLRRILCNVMEWPLPPVACAACCCRR